MNVLDIIILLLFLPGIIRGLTKGLIEQAVSLAGIVASVWAAYKYYGKTIGQDAPYISLSEFRREIDLCRQAWYVKGHIWFRTENILQDEFKAYILSELYSD